MLLTKLHIPPATQNTVDRPELFEKLSMGLCRELTLVSAPAGLLFVRDCTRLKTIRARTGYV